MNSKIELNYIYFLCFICIYIDNTSACGKFTKIDHNLGHKEKLHRFQKQTEYRQSSDCNTIKLEFNNHQKISHYHLEIFFLIISKQLELKRKPKMEDCLENYNNLF